MKRVLTISYWCASIFLVAIELVSVGYSISEAFFMGCLFLPGALCIKYFFPMVEKENRGNLIKSYVFIVLGIITTELLLIMITHYVIILFRGSWEHGADLPAIPDLMINPVFISIMIAVLAIGDFAFEKWLDRKFTYQSKPISFLSERKKISLLLDDILFVESNDDFTIIVAIDGSRYKNKTPISKWEDVLGSRFIRIHRSYLVNKSRIDNISSESVSINNYELPISRKYRSLTYQKLLPLHVISKQQDS